VRASISILQTNTKIESIYFQWFIGRLTSEKKIITSTIISLIQTYITIFQSRVTYSLAYIKLKYIVLAFSTYNKQKL